MAIRSLTHALIREIMDRPHLNMLEHKLQIIKKGTAIFIALLVLGGSFFVGYSVGYRARPPVDIVNVVSKNPQGDDNVKAVDFTLFWDVWSHIEEKYVDKGNINREKLVFGAISGLVKALGDPYTEFFPPQETKQFQEDIKGAFGGIGAEIGMRKGILTIISPIKDSPAERAGLKAGDKILKIDDTGTSDLSLTEAVGKIRGEVGTKVRLTIFREEDGEKPIEVTVTRDTIKIPIIKTEKKGDVFVIQLYHFTENSGFEFRKAIQEFSASGSKKLILDLRNNPGGFLVMAVDIASWFAGPGDVIARERFGDGSEEVYRSSGYRVLEKTPTVILVNEGSASASEIVAGALRDLRGIKLIGQKTFGKGSVQELINLEQNSSVKITIAKWLTPNGTEINEKGLEPDVKVEIPKEPEEGKDYTMERALEVLRGM